MQRIVSHIFVGTIKDIPFAEQAGYSILGACKNPLHRQHAKLQGENEEGYIGCAMPKNEPEYLFAERDHALYLNLIDAREAKYIPDEVIDKALEFIDKEIANGRDVLICCNKGESRSPSVALMWLMKNNRFDRYYSIETIISIFENEFYQNYNPSNGMKEYVTNFWDKYNTKI